MDFTFYISIMEYSYHIKFLFFHILLNPFTNGLGTAVFMLLCMQKLLLIEKVLNICRNIMQVAGVFRTLALDRHPNGLHRRVGFVIVMWPTRRLRNERVEHLCI